MTATDEELAALAEVERAIQNYQHIAYPESKNHLLGDWIAVVSMTPTDPDLRDNTIYNFILANGSLPRHIIAGLFEIGRDVALEEEDDE